MRILKESSVPASPRIRSLVLLTALTISLPVAAQSPQSPAATSPGASVHLTAEQDHQRLMDLLHIKEIRPAANGAANATDHLPNYDESKAGPDSPLPDPLVFKNGKPVKSAKDWEKKRRAELFEDFDREIYGRVPAHTPSVKWEVVSTTNETNGDVPVITVNIELTLSTPAKATTPVPVMMELAFSKEVMDRIAKLYPEMAKQAAASPTWEQQLLAKGWGYAIYVPTSVQADKGDGLQEGIIGLVNKGQPRKLDDWGALRVWAWGASRCLDYFETDKSVDAKQVGITGHSRYGKASLVAMAYDQRFAIAYISSPGAGGAELYRRNFGEQMGNLAGTGEYHWFAGNFIKYDGPLYPKDLPVDSHELIALCAPRPVFIGGGALQGDGWVDAKGTFLAAVAAGPVYKLLGKEPVGTVESGQFAPVSAAQFPPIETPLIDGDIAFRQHSAG